MGSKRKMNALLKKSAAVLTASAMIAAGPSMVLADGTYQDTEKKALETFAGGIVESWDKSLEEMSASENTGKAKMTLKLEEAGRSFLGFFVPIDISWLDTVSMDMDVSIIEGVEAVSAGILLNDAPLATMNMLMDLAGSVEYVQIPELTESWVKAALIAEGENGSEASIEAMEAFYSSIADLASVVPEGETVKTLLERYGNLVIDHMEEGPSIEETVSVEGIGEDCTVYEGQMYEKNATELVKDILTTAKDDAELKTVIENAASISPDSGDLYGKFQKAAENALADFEAESSDEDTSDTGYISSKIWVNGEGRIVGRELGFCEGVDSQPLLTWKSPSDGDSSAFLLELMTDQNAVTITGSGETKDGMLNGTYNLAIDHVSAVDIQVTDYDVESAKTGYPNGSFAFNFVQNMEGEQEAANPLGNLGLVLNLISDEAAGTSDIELGMTSAGAMLGSLIISGSNEKADETPKMEDLGTVYDASSEEDMNAYLAEINWDTVLENAGKAGVPEALVAQLEAMLQYSLSEGSAVEEGAAGEESLEEYDIAPAEGDLEE